MGAELIAVSPQTAEHSAAIARRAKLPFPVLHDPGHAWLRQLGLTFRLDPELEQLYQGFGIDVAKYNGDDSGELPIPARLVVGQDGIVRAVEADPDYTSRPEPEDSLAALRAAGA